MLQARFSSSRLPGKALLPIGGMPMVVLAARRAMRDGMNLVVATSTDRSDDAIVEACGAANIPVFRGSLENVYERFIGATADLDDDAIVVRLTGDNVVPDGQFIQAVVDRLLTKNVSYLAPRWPEDGLPYGVIAEAFRMGELRRARPEGREDAEHVTPALRRKFENPGFGVEVTDLSHVRATVDTPDDYSCVSHVFMDQADPVGLGLRQLCENLANIPGPRAPWALKAGRFQSQVTLGGAQLGMPYGVANLRGMPSDNEVERIIHAAIERGVTHIDTAQLYGQSESRIGAALEGWLGSRIEVITKLQPIEIEDAGTAQAQTVKAVTLSLKALRVERIETLLLHRVSNRSTAGGAVWDALLDLKRRKMVGRLGVSVQDPAEFESVADDPDVELIQLPFNLLDRRWESLTPRRDDLTIHARSVFLQGLLAGVPASGWPLVAGVDSACIMRVLAELTQELGFRGIADLAVAFARAQPWVDSLVIGVETEAQLNENLERFTTPPLSAESVDVVRRRIPMLPNQLINPALWRFQ